MPLHDNRMIASRSLRRTAATPYLRPVTAQQAKPSFEDLVRELKSQKEARARAVWNASGLEQVAKQSAAAAPSAEVSGAAMLTPNLYRLAGGDIHHPMIPENGSIPWAVLEVAGLLPFGRPLRAGAAGVKRLLGVKRAAEGVTKAAETARLPAGAEADAVRKYTEAMVKWRSERADILRNRVPSEELIAQAPWLRHTPVLINPKDPSDIRVLVGATEHRELNQRYRGMNTAEGGWHQATAVFENGKVAGLNFPSDATGMDEFGKYTFRSVPSLHDQEVSLKALRAQLSRPIPPIPTRPELGSLKAAETAKLPAGAEKITGALKEVKGPIATSEGFKPGLRSQQEALRRVERGKRVAKAAEAMKVGGREGYQAALHELKGELPKVQFGALKEMDQGTVEELLSYAGKHPDLQFFEQVRTQAAIVKMVDEGRLPTRSEQLLLERAFGPEVTAQLMDSRGFWRQSKELGLSLINVPRALRSSFDLSAPFRQGLVLGARHPVMFTRELTPMVKAAFSEKYFMELMDGIVSSPTYEISQKAGLQLTDLEASVYGREEGFMSNLAEKIPVIGRVVRGSGRGYVGFLNKFRKDAFDNYLLMIEQPYRTTLLRKRPGLDLNGPKNAQAVRDIANWVNTATGRGSIKQMEDSMVALNALIFSPRLIASRIQLLNPAYYAKLDPFARKQAIRGMAQLLGGISLTLWIAKMAGAEVVMDPRSSDFGKIKVGDTRVDLAGGFQQYLVYAARFIKGETVSSTTGKVNRLEGGFGSKSRASITWDFIENKLAPVPGLGVKAAEGKNFAGDKFNPLKETGRIFLPLNAENTYEGYTVGGPKSGAASFALGGIGFGTQTYKPNKKKSSGNGGSSKSIRSGGSGSGSLRGRSGQSRSLRGG